MKKMIEALIFLISAVYAASITIILLMMPAPRKYITAICLTAIAAALILLSAALYMQEGKGPEIKPKNILRHFKTICVHKYWVFHYCRLMGIPLQGLTHDLSKFSPVEFWEGVRWYQVGSSPINACKAANGVSMAWMHHKGRNPHHYEYWQDNFDMGGHPVEMPFKYKIEMLCDFLGAGHAYYGKGFTYKKEADWWEMRSSRPMAMHPNDKKFIDAWIRLLAEKGDAAFDEVLKGENRA